MKKEKRYCCSLCNDKEIYNNQMFDNFEEAKQIGINILKDFNKNFYKANYDVDEDVFDDELVSMLDEIEEVNNIIKSEILKIDKIEEFYIIEFERPTIPESLGEDVVEIVDDRYFDEINFCFEEPTLQKHLGDEKIKELSQIIYEFLDKETADYDYTLACCDYIVGVEK